MRRSVTIAALAVGFVAPHEAAAARPPKDAFGSSPVRIAPTRAQRDAWREVRKPGTELQTEERLGVPTVLWAGDETPAPGAPATAARTYLKRLAPAYRLSGNDVDAARVSSVQDTGNGMIIVKLRQAVAGVPVFRDEANVVMTQDNELVGVSGYLPPATGSPAFALAGRDAAARAVNDLGKGAATTPKQVMFQLPDRLVSAYYVEVTAGREAYGYVIAADDGRVLFRNSLVHLERRRTPRAPFSYRVWADPVTHVPLPSPWGDGASPHPTGLPDGFEPPFTAPSLVTLSSGPISTRDPWLPAGATETTGNNADAFADRSEPDGFTPGTDDIRPTITGPNTFDRAYDPTRGPLDDPAQSQAAVTQLFYTGNFLHDWFYDAGFDEASGNAQADNYGRGGIGGDALSLQADDFAYVDNAQMTVFADGTSPVGEFFPWQATNASVHVDAPAGVAGSYPAGYASFGPSSFDVSGDLVHAGVTCEPLKDPSAVAGHIAVVDIGPCLYTKQVLNAQNAGAKAVILVDYYPWYYPPRLGGQDPAVTVPTLSLMQPDGQRLEEALSNGAVTATLRRSTGPDRDTAIDNQVVAHEWAHYLTERLVGNANGMVNTQSFGLSEGWSDFVALLLTVRPEDAASNYAGAYSMGGYSIGGAEDDAAYYGLRRVPYSTDFAKDGLTFRHIAEGESVPHRVKYPMIPNWEAHNSGEVWATMLWECYAALLRDSGRLTFDEAQRRMRDYLVASLKLTPLDPTMLEARDALLMAAYARDRRDFRLFWQAFARRGAGAGAVAPERYSSDNVPVKESYAAGASLAFERATLRDDLRSCDRQDGFLDGGERGTLEITLRNDGAQPLRRTTVSVSSTDPAVQVASRAVAVRPTRPLDEVTVTVPVRLAPGTRGPRALPFSIAYGDADLTGGPATATYVAHGAVDARPSASDDVEAAPSAWTVRTDTGRWPWERASIGDPLNTLWHGPDRFVVGETSLISPPLTVGSSPLRLSFRHRFRLEPGWDGGVVELSADDGKAWTDIGAGYTGTISTYAVSPLAGRDAFTGASAGYPAFANQTIDLGTAYAGRTVRVRFRVASDDYGEDLGWDVDDIAATGVTNLPFTTLAADDGCRLR